MKEFYNLLLKSVVVLILALPFGLTAQMPRLLTQVGHEFPVGSLALSPGGRLLASADTDGLVKIWDVWTGVNRYQFRGYPPIRFSHDGSFLVVNKRSVKNRFILGQRAKTLIFYDTQTWRQVDKMRHMELGDLVLEEAYKVKQAKRKIVLVPKKRGYKRKKVKEKAGKLLASAVSFDGKYIAGAWASGELVLYERGTGEKVKQIMGKVMYAQNAKYRCPIQAVEFGQLQFTSNTKYLVFGNTEQISVADIEKGEVTHKLYLQPDLHTALGAVPIPAHQNRARLILRDALTSIPIQADSVIELGPGKQLAVQAYTYVPWYTDLERKPNLANLKKQLEEAGHFGMDSLYHPEKQKYKEVVSSPLMNELCGCKLGLPSGWRNVREEKLELLPRISRKTMRNDSSLSMEEKELPRKSQRVSEVNLSFEPLLPPPPVKKDSDSLTLVLPEFPTLQIDPLLPNRVLDSVLPIPFQPGDSILEYYLTYAAMAPGGLLHPDTLMDIARDRGDQELEHFLEQQSGGGAFRQAQQKLNQLVMKHVGLEDHSDTIKVEVFESGKEPSRKEKRLFKRQLYDRDLFKISQDGSHLTFLVAEDSILLFDLMTGECIRETALPVEKVSDYEFAPDGNYVFTSGLDRHIIMWKIPDWQPIRVFSRGTMPVNQILSNQNITGLMTGDFSKGGGGGNFWDLSRGEKVAYLDRDNYSMNRSGFDSSGNYLLSEGIYNDPKYFETIVLDLKARQKLDFQVEFGFMQDVVVLDSPNVLLVTGGAHDWAMAQRRALGSGKLEHSDEFGKGRILKTLLSPAGDKAYLMGQEGGIYTMGTATGQLVDELKVSEHWILDADIHGEENVMVVGGNDKFLRLVDLESQAVIKVSDTFPNPIKQVKFSRDGKRIALADVEDNVMIVQTATLKPEFALPWRDEQVYDLTWSQDGSYLSTTSRVGGLAQSGKGLNAFRLWNLEKREEDKRFEFGDTLGLPLLIALHPAEDKVLVGGNGRPVRGYDLRSGKMLFESGRTSGLARSVVYAPDGSSFATVSLEIDTAHANYLDGTVEGSKVRIWDTETGRRIKTLGLNFSGIFIGNYPLAEFSNFRATQELTYSRDGSHLILKHWNGGFTVLDVRTDKEPTVLENRSDYYAGTQYYQNRFYHFYRGKYKKQREKSARLEQGVKDASKKLKKMDRLSQRSGFFSYAGERLKENEKFAEAAEAFSLIKEISETALMEAAEKRNYPGVHQVSKHGTAHDKSMAIVSLGEERKDSADKSIVKFPKMTENVPGKSKFARKRIGLQKNRGNLKKAMQQEHIGTMNSVYRPKEGFFISTGNDSKVVLWDQEEGEDLLQIVSSFDNKGHVLFNDDNNYLASKNASEMVAFELENRLYPYEAFDLHLNRPDLVLKELPGTDSIDIAPFEGAYHRRLKRMGVEESGGQLSFSVPSLYIVSPAPEPAIEDSVIEIFIHAVDHKQLELIRLEGWVNDVPLFGLDGIDLSAAHRSELDTTIRIRLQEGRNKIQFGVINEKLNKSWKETCYVDYVGPTKPKRLFVVALGVSDYGPAVDDLRFPSTDARYLAQFLENQESALSHYAAVRSLVLTDQEVSPNSPDRIADFLKGAGENDVVLFFLSGHGQNSPIDYEYYFLTPEFDGMDYQSGGISFRQLEEVLAGTRARNKMMILNTCMAGDVDRESNPIQAGDDFISMKEIFLDLRRSSGATILAASSGYGYALETIMEGEVYGPMVKFITEFLESEKGPFTVTEFCARIIYLFERRRGILALEPEIRFSNLGNDFRLF